MIRTINKVLAYLHNLVFRPHSKALGFQPQQASLVSNHKDSSSHKGATSARRGRRSHKMISSSPLTTSRTKRSKLLSNLVISCLSLGPIWTTHSGLCSHSCPKMPLILWMENQHTVSGSMSPTWTLRSTICGSCAPNNKDLAWVSAWASSSAPW